MIFCTTQPMDKYTDVIKGVSAGVGSYYEHRPYLLSLILLSTTIGFDYEMGTMQPVGQRAMIANNEDMFIDTLDQAVNGLTIKDLLKNKNPMEIYHWLSKEDLTHLKMCDPNQLGGMDAESRLMIVMARAIAWAEAYTGPLMHTGNVVKVKFGGEKESMVTAQSKRFLQEFKKVLIRNRLLAAKNK